MKHGVRQSAAAAMGELGDARALRPLCEAMRNRSLPACGSLDKRGGFIAPIREDGNRQGTAWTRCGGFLQKQVSRHDRTTSGYFGNVTSTPKTISFTAKRRHPRRSYLSEGGRSPNFARNCTSCVDDYWTSERAKAANTRPRGPDCQSASGREGPQRSRVNHVQTGSS